MNNATSYDMACERMHDTCEKMTEAINHEDYSSNDPAVVEAYTARVRAAADAYRDAVKDWEATPYEPYDI